MAESRTQFHKYATMEGHEPRSMTQKEYEGNLKRLEVLNSISEYECSANFGFIQHITIGASPANVEMLLLGGFNMEEIDTAKTCTGDKIDIAILAFRMCGAARWSIKSGFLPESAPFEEEWAFRANTTGCAKEDA